ncbi:MAG TPA: succinyldiaminopimelate transaminase [Actinophytocola sp.]|uniref:succinyldiaminopimelate transaminase n=1 Tax=Actinophytocola sp. TaxID=1872138 RepID=UPI002DBA3A47|nr:succinyldiaminopimelate transaminase [Actinophytocola sp.]HEU5472102.1 succinyldiaminopimelate transaminase [Actinophytocola sp.]
MIPRRGAALPDYPWDTLAEHSARAAAHPDGLVNLSIGTPVDPVPSVIQAALAAAADAPGYPATHGTPELRKAAVDALRRRHGVEGVEPDAVLPTIGSKELVAWLPTLLGVGPGDVVVLPELAYPTYDVGVRLAGAEPVRADGLLALGPARPVLVWLNSPGNPTGRVLPAEHLRKVLAWARERDAVVVSDECYLTLGWETEPVSILHPSVCGGVFDGLLAVHSLSKCSNLAGYRAGFVTGDPTLVAALLAVRRHAGMIVPRPVQAAMTAALSDDSHVAEQRARFAARRSVLRAALTRAGFRIDHSEAGLYLWATRDEDAWDTVGWLAERGILVAPGTFYGRTGGRHVRIALTAPDDRIAAALTRLSGI